MPSAETSGEVTTGIQDGGPINWAVCSALLGTLGGRDVLVGPSGIQPSQAVCFQGLYFPSYLFNQPSHCCCKRGSASSMPSLHGVCIEPRKRHSSAMPLAFLARVQSVALPPWQSHVGSRWVSCIPHVHRASCRGHHKGTLPCS